MWVRPLKSSIRSAALVLPVVGFVVLTACATVPDDPACLEGTYSVDELFNEKGPNQCADACDCDGERTCSDKGFCQGTARDCAREDYTWDEATNPEGPNLCTNDCQCDGARTCSNLGQCEGVAR